ncbi:MAG: helix-turn-helix domain-containing protein [Bacillota bacterium]
MGVAGTIARLRRERGLTQAELSRTTGLSRGYIAAIEQGRRHPTIKTLAIIAEALGVEIEVLTEEEEE